MSDKIEQEKRITECKVGPYPRPMPAGMFDAMPEVNVIYDDGTKEKLYSFYPDELRFTEKEFIGLTRKEAIDLKHNKDVKYLQS